MSARRIAGLLTFVALACVLLVKFVPEDETRVVLSVYDAPDDEIAKSLNLDPDTVTSKSQRTIEETVGEIQKKIKDVLDYEKKIDKQAKKSQPIKIRVKVGQKGPPGPDGPTGYTGPEGRTGRAGDPGRRGPRGPVGKRGDKGEKGPPGLMGAIGPPGPRGAQGEPGEPGRQGRTGRDGEQGPQGVPGAHGKIGAPGINGAPGPAGANAAVGAPGPAGKRGAEGPQGPQGQPGTVGLPGRQGRIGEPGLPGDSGPSGAMGPRGSPGAPEWRVVLKSRENNNDWAYDSAWWSDLNVYNDGDASDTKNVKTGAFNSARINSIKININKRTYIFTLPPASAGTMTMRDLVTSANGVELSAPGWKGSALDVFGIASERDPNTQQRWYCDNMAFHFTPFFQNTMDANTHCSSVARIGTVLSADRNCQNPNAVKPTTAEGIGLWNSCDATKLGSGRLQGSTKYFTHATIWVS